MLAGTVTRRPRSSRAVVSAGACKDTTSSTSADRTTCASVSRLVSWSWRTDAGAGAKGLPTDGLISTRVVLV